MRKFLSFTKTWLVVIGTVGVIAFTATLLAGAACYVLALLLIRKTDPQIA